MKFHLFVTMRFHPLVSLLTTEGKSHFVSCFPLCCEKYKMKYFEMSQKFARMTFLTFWDISQNFIHSS